MHPCSNRGPSLLLPSVETSSSETSSSCAAQQDDEQLAAAIQWQIVFCTPEKLWLLIERHSNCSYHKDASAQQRPRLPQLKRLCLTAVGSPLFFLAVLACTFTVATLRGRTCRCFLGLVLHCPFSLLWTMPNRLCCPCPHLAAPCGSSPLFRVQ